MSIKSSGIKIYLNHPSNLIKTGFLVFTWMILGFHLELIGPTMPILAANIKVDFNGMGSVLASRSAGYFFANILGIILQNIVKKHSEGLLICAFILPAIVVFVTPFMTSFILMCIAFFIQGIAQGFTDLGGNNLLLTMWGVNAAAALSTAHFGYGIGAVFVNLLIRPFLIKKVLSNNEGINSNIFIPYAITAGLCILIAVGHLVFYIRELKNQKQKLQIRLVDYTAVSTNPKKIHRLMNKEKSSPYSPRTCGRGYFQYGLILSTIFICYTFFIGGNDQTFSKFFFTYLKFEKFNISTGAASWGIILYWLSYSIGRLIGAIISVFVPVNICLHIVWFGGLCLAIAWFIFVWIIGLTGTSLFVLGSLTGLVISPLFSLSFGLFNQRLNVIPMLLALLLCGSALGAIIFQKIAGFVMEHNPNHFPTLLIISTLMAIILYVASNLVYFFHRRKNLLNTQVSVTNGAALSPEGVSEEEQQMAIDLKD